MLQFIIKIVKNYRESVIVQKKTHFLMNLWKEPQQSSDHAFRDGAGFFSLTTFSNLSGKSQNKIYTSNECDDFTQKSDYINFNFEYDQKCKFNWLTDEKMSYISGKSFSTKNGLMRICFLGSWRSVSLMNIQSYVRDITKHWRRDVG